MAAVIQEQPILTTVLEQKAEQDPLARDALVGTRVGLNLPYDVEVIDLNYVPPYSEDPEPITGSRRGFNQE